MSEKPVLETAPVNHSSKMILLIAVVLTVAVLVIRNFEATKNILLVLLGFGAVVLVHEFGHFIVAKACGIKVEAFSIFMPPILFGIKKVDRGWRIRILPELFRRETKEGEESSPPAGEVSPAADEVNEGLFGFTVGKKILPGETEYRIGLIPFGGFVKMVGQDDVGPVKTSSDPRSFANKPLWARASVLAAGVTFNALSAVVVFMIAFLVGIGLPAPIVGGVLPGSPAEKAGIRPGDEVVEVAGEDGRLDYSDIMMAAVLSGKSKEIPMKIKREDGTIKDVSLTAQLLPGGQFRDFGIQRPSILKIAQLRPESAALLKETTGLEPGDQIKAVDRFYVNSYWQMKEIVEKTFEPNVTLIAQRTDASGQTQLIDANVPLAFPAVLPGVSESEADIANICGMVPRMRMVGVSDGPGSFKEWLLGLFGMAEKRERLMAGDIIVGAGEIENPTYSEMRQQINEYENKTLSITVIRTDVNGVQKRLIVPTFPKKQGGSERVIIGIIIPLDLDVEEPVVAKTIATLKVAEPLAIPRGARIMEVDGVEVSNFFDVARELRKNAGSRITIDWRLDEQRAGSTAVKVGKAADVTAGIGAVFGQPVPFADLERLYKADGPVDAVEMGYKRTKIFIIQSYVTFQRLVSGLISPKQLMGPVGILTASYQIVATRPFVYYLYFLGLISACIAVLNFMPFPPLDGGLTVLLFIEKIKGSALSVRTQEIIAYVGWGLVGALFLYVTFNDIVRSFFGG